MLPVVFREKAQLFKALGRGGGINGQRKTLLKCHFGTLFLDWTCDVWDSSFTNTEPFLNSNDIFDTYATRAFQRAVPRPIILKTREVRAPTRKSPGGPPLEQKKSRHVVN